jgi:hypothetical protein
MEQDDQDMMKGMTFVFGGIIAMFFALLYLANVLG